MTYSSLTMSQRPALRKSAGHNNKFAGRNQNAVDYRLNRSTKLGPISNTVILIVLACLLGLMYLTQVTKTDPYGYSIDKLQTQQTQLKSENDDLVLASAQMQSIDRVQTSPQATAMVPLTPSGTVR